MRGRKIRFTIKLVLVWGIAVVLIVARACIQNGESIGLFWADLTSDFVDNTFFPQTFKNKLLFVTVFCMILWLVGIFTEEFHWSGKFLKWRVTLKGGSKLIPVCEDILLIILAAGLILQLKGYLQPEIQSVFSESWEGDILIAHAGGGIDEDNYTNSLEAFEASYARGNRTIELDFLVTEDDEMVCWHDWSDPIDDSLEEDEVPMLAQFMSGRIYGKYTPLSLADVFELMKKYEDVYVVTDTKNDRWADIKKDFQVILDTAQDTDSMGVLDRLVVQLYNHDMYDAVNSIYPFPNYILTLYLTGGSEGADFIEHCRFCKNRGIKGITMWESWVNSDNLATAKRYGLDIYVHTVNSIELLEKDEARGVRGFYTDFVYPDMLGME